MTKIHLSKKRVGDLTIQELQWLIESSIRNVLDQILPDEIDTDRGLELRPEVEARLRKYLDTPLENQTFYSLEDIAKELGLDD